ncbi:MAG TPA: SGNH/GDSL hydrolase family protein, partial [Puia sp.]|nr:SGNH/GDSL hydrolase family protein [Puia sp.]
AVGFASTAQVRPFQPFQTGDRIAFVGNSITEQGYYESYIWLYYMLHFPDRRIVILNRGIGGDRAQNIYDRFDDDVAHCEPTVICLTFGMNDSGYFEFLRANADSLAKVHFQESHHYFELIEEKLKAMSRVKKIIILGSPFDETARIKGANNFPGKVKVMEEIAGFQTQAAKDNHWGLVDFLHPMTEIDLREQKKDSTFTLTGNDRIHPGNSGHFVMAWLFLKAQGLGNSPVADIAIDGRTLHVDRAANCRITNLAADKATIHFDYLANSLPFPVDTVPRLWGNPHRQSEAIGVMPFYSEFNREMLRISGLSAGTYELTIDNHRIAQFTAAELGQGINLAKQTNTPEYEQAMSVLQLNEERMGLESKLRAYYWLQFDYLRGIGLKFKDTQAAMDSVNNATQKDWAVASKRDNYRAARYPAVRAAWQKETDLLINDIYTVNQPKMHRVEIKKLPE